MLKTAANDPSGMIMRISNLSAILVQAGETVMNENSTQRESAKWIDALQELVRMGFVEQSNSKGDLFRITNAGYKYTEQ